MEDPDHQRVGGNDGARHDDDETRHCGLPRLDAGGLQPAGNGKCIKRWIGNGVACPGFQCELARSRCKAEPPRPFRTRLANDDIHVAPQCSREREQPLQGIFR